VRRQRFTATFVETERVVKKEFRHAARRQPGETVLIAQAPEREAPIANEAVPAEESRLDPRTGHRLDGIPHKLADMSKGLRHRTTLRHTAATRRTVHIKWRGNEHAENETGTQSPHP
jgi:hypothetical protein